MNPEEQRNMHLTLTNVSWISLVPYAYSAIHISKDAACFLTYRALAYKKVSLSAFQLHGFLLAF